MSKVNGFLITANLKFRNKEFEEALDYYRRFVASKPSLAKFIELNIQLCRRELEKAQKIVLSSNAPLVSIIVPVHNVENYIEGCLNSILNQSLKNIEIVIVDDCSTDSSAATILQRSAIDKRIVFIHNSVASGNSGTPRNQALMRAKGEFVAFVDSDDWIDADMLGALYQKAIETNSDIVSSGGFYRELEDGTTELVRTINNNYDLNQNDSRYSLYLSPHFPIVWFRLYRRSFIMGNQIKFGETKTSADLPFSFKALFCANKIVALQEIYYHYRFDRPGSTIDRRKGRGAFEVFSAYQSIIDYLKCRNLLNKFMPYVMLKALGDYCYNSRFLADKFKGEFKDRMRSFVLKYYDSKDDYTVLNKYWTGVLDSFLDKEAVLAIDSGPLGNFQDLSHDVKVVPLVSIIVAAHNVERYISRCLNSISMQTLSKIEIIVTNDGSTDKTRELIKDHMKNDGRIILIDCNLASGNPGTPRNIALCIAKGEYIGFVDSDDWVERDMFEGLYAKAIHEKYDIVSASAFWRHEGETIKKCPISYKTISSAIKNNKDAFKSDYFSNIWNRIYKRSFIGANDIYMPRIYLAEDFCFSAVCHALAENTATADGSYYHYNYDRPESTTFLRKGEKGFAIVDSYDEMVQYLSLCGVYDNYASQIIHKKINSLWYTYDRLDGSQLKDEFLSRFRLIYKKMQNNAIDFSVFSDSELQRLNLLKE